jgi:hypothetical protein
MPPRRALKQITVKAKSSSTTTPAPQITLGAEADELAPSSPTVNTQAEPPESTYPSLDDPPTDDNPDPFEEEPNEADKDIRTTWSPEMNEQLVEVLYTTWQDGGASDNSFKMTVFEKAAGIVHRVYKGPREITSKMCKNK